MSATKRAATWLALTGLVGAAAVTSTVTASAASVELPVYAVRSAGLSLEQATALQRAFGLKSVERDQDGSVSFTDEATYLKVPGLDKGAGRPDEDGLPTHETQLDVEALKQLRAVPTDVAVKKVQEALRGAGLLPANAVASATNTTFDVVGTDGSVVVSAPLDTAVSFAFSLDGIPLEGGGAKVRVALDGQGAVSGLVYSTRDLVKVGTVKSLDLTEARTRCAKVFAADTQITGVSYAYDAPALSEKPTRLEPSIRCAGTDPNGATVQPVTLPAAVDGKLPEPGPTQPPRTETGGGVSAQWIPRIDVGSEGTGRCAGLPWTANDVNGFNNQFTSRGIPVQYSWLDQNAWERDFKDPAFAGGWDQLYADDVDLSYWHGRGSPTGFSFAGCSSNTDTFLSNRDARWGNRDLEWISLFTASILQTSAGGQNWAQRWGRAFNGLHQINSFETVSYHHASHGARYGNYLLRNRPAPMKVRDAWAQASIDTQPPWVRWATMGPIGYSWIANYNDYFWNKGPVGPDTLPTVGFWRISGWS
ncbi:DUF6345 domain-containing protein [Actinosynnema sp. NPDC047251]|uniref:Secreted protein n=1 Tax=Saccharothrix espanaensis (strain ATCC 51144 / DSM 44229 / JCM 9112 / NBRC 15066 / NRRL 15764) TaxID=1179773 RepID=K0JS17_SACES|nr:DUF6345 domain-containing protein [Saccharothrix espanaensis]CCH28297.1 hypothetical protein BN6_09680 [Saccharothrix espanaensis DSM 44229]